MARLVRVGGMLFALACMLLLQKGLSAQRLWPVPPEIASTHFTVTINGVSTPVMHASENLYFLNFEAKPHRLMHITVTADRDDFWATGVEVQPWRLGIRPERNGKTIAFDLNGPAKISISRPGDFLSEAEMLYLFANVPEAGAPTGAGPLLQYFGPGVHRENIDAVDGGRIYLAPGAVVFGGLNIWGVHDVKVFGRGTIVYDGAQNPADDDGWMHKKIWHCIVMDNAHDISIEGITCVVRSRTWQIQMKDSGGIHFDNVKVIGANSGNANGDGMDWLGGGDTTVNDSFFRAADDVFSMEGSWDGYGPEAFAEQGNPVSNIAVTDSVLSTSISNVVRAGWPEKNFEGSHFSMKNSDVLHAGLGGCGIPFALMEIWADPNGRGQTSDFRFDDVRLEDWYSLTQLMEPKDGISGVHFTDVAALEQPAMVASVLKGKVRDTVLSGVTLTGKLASSDGDVPIEAVDCAEKTVFANGTSFHIEHDEGLLRPHDLIRFHAVADRNGKTDGLRFDWTFGDGTYASGLNVTHRFPDKYGTLRDGSGRFRVLLHVTGDGRSRWAYAPVILAAKLEAPADDDIAGQAPGLTYSYFELAPPALHDMGPGAPAQMKGIAVQFTDADLRQRSSDYGVVFSGYIDAPADGGYVFTLVSNDQGEISVDGHLLGQTPKPFAQVCGLAGNAARPVSGSIALAHGRHKIDVRVTHTLGNDDFKVWWQTPGNAIAREVPAEVLSHAVTQNIVAAPVGTGR
jgi:hypothetical protein